MARHIDGKMFDQYSRHFTKTAAKEAAKKLRKEDRDVRVIKTAAGHEVFAAARGSRYNKYKKYH